MEELKERYLSMDIPTDGLQEMQKRINMAKSDKIKRGRIYRIKMSAITVAAAALTLVILPNVNADIASAMERIPVIGKIIHVVTLDNYTYEDENNIANVEIPQITQTQDNATPNADNSLGKINKGIIEYTDMLIEQFEKDILEQKEGHHALDITWDVVTDTKDWFTLRVNIFETKGSGYQRYAFYHINKMTDEIAELKDLFVEDADYISIISENIKSQMRVQMENEDNIYFLENEQVGQDNFKAIKENQNFYFNEDNQLVIVFDEYEVAPGYMGSVEFVIEHEVIKNILK